MLRAPLRKSRAPTTNPSQIPNLLSQIHAILNALTSTQSFEQIYSAVYKAVIANLSAQLHDQIIQTINEYIKQQSTKTQVHEISKFSETLQQKVRAVEDVTMYLWRNFMEAARMESFGREAERKLGEIMVKERLQQITSFARSSLKHAREVFKMTSHIDRSPLAITIDQTEATETYRRTVTLLKQHQLYGQEFKECVITDTKEFYEAVQQPVRIGLEYIPQNLLYFIMLEGRLHSEIHSETFEAVQSTLLDIFLPDEKSLNATDYTRFSIDNYLAKLKEVFFIQTSRHTPLLRSLKHWTANGHDQHKSFIESLLELRKHMDTVVSRMDSREVGDAINDGFAIQLQRPKAQELLASSIDAAIKRSSKTTDQDIQESADTHIALFTASPNKDVFSKWYQLFLARRLLSRNVNEDLERMYISRLKMECGVQYTQRMEGMFNDLRVSLDTMSHYKTRERADDAKKAAEINVRVLTPTNWPTQGDEQSTLTKHLQSMKQEFESWYLARHTGRKLTWPSYLGEVEVNAILGKEISISANPQQVSILMLFNEEAVELSMQAIQELVQMPADVVEKVLASISLSRFPLLLRTPTEGKLIKPTDIFRLNISYKPSQTKIKLPSPPSARPDNPAPEVESERKYIIDAAIVRIMKSRQTIEHSALILAVFDALQGKFSIDNHFVKNRIEVLIERQFLKRSEDGIGTYTYIA